MKKRLEIFIITYNRDTYLQELLDTILSENSPIKNFDIKILDNNSTDNTSSVVALFKTTHANITYIKNNRNIGLLGNFAKAVEMSSKDYFWCLCDNDYVDFSAWGEVETAINSEMALINVCKILFPKLLNTPAGMLCQSIFLPGFIYKTSYITDDVMSCVMSDIHTVYAQCSLAACIYNKIETANKMDKIFSTSKNIINYGNNISHGDLNKYNNDRIDAKTKNLCLSKRLKSKNQLMSVISVFSLLQDKNIYKNIMDIMVKCYSKPRVLLIDLFKGNSDFKLFIWFFINLNFKNQMKFYLELFNPGLYHSLITKK